MKTLIIILTMFVGIGSVQAQEKVVWNTITCKGDLGSFYFQTTAVSEKPMFSYIRARYRNDPIEINSRDGFSSYSGSFELENGGTEMQFISPVRENKNSFRVVTVVVPAGTSVSSPANFSQITETLECPVCRFQKALKMPVLCEYDVKGPVAPNQ